MSIHQTPLDGLDQLISIDELSEHLGVPVKTIYDWRLADTVPARSASLVT